MAKLRGIPNLRFANGDYVTSYVTVAKFPRVKLAAPYAFCKTPISNMQIAQP